MSDKTDRTAATAPHPVLKKYYESESGRRPFVSALFDNAAQHYDWVCAMGSLGSGRFYRSWVLTQSGLRGGMKFLDIATGTGDGAYVGFIACYLAAMALTWVVYLRRSPGRLPGV